MSITYKKYVGDTILESIDQFTHVTVTGGSLKVLGDVDRKSTIVIQDAQEVPSTALGSMTVNNSGAKIGSVQHFTGPVVLGSTNISMGPSGMSVSTSLTGGLSMNFSGAADIRKGRHELVILGNTGDGVQIQHNSTGGATKIIGKMGNDNIVIVSGDLNVGSVGNKCNVSLANGGRLTVSEAIGNSFGAVVDEPGCVLVSDSVLPTDVRISVRSSAPTVTNKSPHM